jgi:class 3 adenylate cyclase
VHCHSCGHGNPEGNKFCGVCGVALAQPCPTCRHANPPDHRFCGACGAELRPATPHTPDPERRPPSHLAQKIRQSKPIVEGERKQVTVLFADVKGSMDLAEQLDPEAWSGIMQRFFRILADGVERFEGFVDKFTGDGTMALFGAPIAHEDHAQRACFAALHLRDELARYATEVKREHGVGFSTRMGINSGEVVVGTIGDDLRMTYTAQGHTVGLAQRMEALASPDTCYVTAATAALVGSYLQLEDLGEFRVKGAAEPMRVQPSRRHRNGNDATRHLARPRPLAFRRPRRRHDDARSRPGRGAGGQRADRRRGGRGGHRQEPALLGVRRTLSRARPHGERGSCRRAREEYSVPAHAGGMPRLLRDR